MKMNLFLVLLLISQTFYCQENISVKKISFEPYFRLNYVMPIQTGNHSLAKDFDSKLGLNANLSLVSYGALNFNAGYEFSQYKVTSISNVGDINHVNFSVIYGEFDYDVTVYNNFKVIPTIGYGYVTNKYKSNNRSFGIQEGSEVRLGTILNYNFTKTFSTFIGFNYMFTNLNINTNKDYEDYFGKANRFQISLGIKFE
jgi:hypothetical protein